VNTVVALQNLQRGAAKGKQEQISVTERKMSDDGRALPNVLPPGDTPQKCPFTVYSRVLYANFFTYGVSPARRDEQRPRHAPTASTKERRTDQ
jgi:hypothetical protein